jgi:hypothetical protein
MKEKYNNINFLNWELFTRENELKSYKLEKEKRENLYKKITKIIEECKEESKNTNIRQEHLIHEKLFGDTNINLIKQDIKIPTQHLIQYYLKAKNPNELTSFHKDSEYHLNKTIIRTNNQIEYLHRIKSDPKWEMRYNKKHFLRFLTKEKSNELQREYDEHKKNKLNETEKIKERIVLTNSSILNHYNQKDLNYEIEILKIIDGKIKELGYDKYNLTEKQKENLNSIRKNEHLRRNIMNKTVYVSDHNEGMKLINEQKAKKNNKDIKVNFFRNNDLIHADEFDLTYDQKKSLIKKENILDNFTEKDMKLMENTITEEKNINKKIKEIKNRQDIENSLRRKKKYHLPEMKKMKTSLDKYTNEDEYYFIKRIKENGITLETNNEGRKNIKI